MVLTTRALPFTEQHSPKLKDAEFGVIIEGVDPNNLSKEEFKEIENLLYKHSMVLFPNANMTPEGQYNLTHSFDEASDTYGHGKGDDGRVGQTKSILHPDLRTLKVQPQVQLIGNGIATDERIVGGLDPPVKLKHPSNTTFHKDPISEEDDAKGITRFYRWHMDAALFKLEPPRITTLYGLTIPEGKMEELRYDDGSGDKMTVGRGATAFVSGKLMFDLLSPEEKSLAVRMKVKYAPHPYIWITPAKSNSLGLGIVSEGKEAKEIPPYDEKDVKVYPATFKNPVTENLHLQIHPSCIQELYIDPLPSGVSREGALYPEGAHITDLEKVRKIVYDLQRPGISSQYVYAHDWNPNDLVIFHNRGVLHTVTGALKPDENRAFWQCNLAASDAPMGPSASDLAAFA